MSDLINVPTFTFEQGDPFQADGNSEYPIQVLYYNGSISLEQNGNAINILPSHLKNLHKEITKHLAEAEHWLKRNNK